MSDPNVEAQPGENRKTELDRGLHGGDSMQAADIRYCPDCGHELIVGIPYCANCGAAIESIADAPHFVELPRKADVAHSDQATRVGPGHLRRTTGSPMAAGTPRIKRQMAAPADEARQAQARPQHPSVPHPLSKRSREVRNAALPVDARGAARGAGRSRSNAPLVRPGKRSIYGLAGFTATFGIVSALLLTLPSHPPVVGPANGSVYSVAWHTATTMPADSLDFGPYFASLDGSILMVGTVNTKASDGSTDTITSKTSVWSTTDGLTWYTRSDPGAFGIDGRRFVAQGISADGQGGLVVVGNSLGKTPTDVTAAAWHSKDGATWTPMQIDSNSGQEMAAGVVSRPGAAVAAGNGVAWLSTDGHSWSPQTLPGAVEDGGSYTPSVVGVFDGGFVIVDLWIGAGASHSAAWFSSTGRDWVQSKTLLNGFLGAGAGAVNGRMVVVGSGLGDSATGLAASWSTSDGDTWTESTAPTDISSVALDGVAAVGHSLMAFGAPDAVAAAPAPAAPAAPQESGTAAASATSAPSATAAPSPTELVWVTDDGINWLPIKSTAPPLTHGRMGVAGNRVVLVGTAASGLTAVTGDATLGSVRPAASQVTAANFALTLKSGNVPLIPDVGKGYVLGPVTTSGSRFYAFATGAAGTYVFNSDVGSLWVTELKPTGLTKISTAGQPVVTGRAVIVQAIPDGKGGILAAGKITNTDGDNGMIWHMVKAGTWKQVNFQDDTPNDFSSIAAGPNGFVASTDSGGGSQIMYSADGEDWQAGSIVFGNGLPLIVASYHYGFVAVGVDPSKGGATTAWTSPDGRTWSMRTDWHLPANVIGLTAMGYGLVATARTALPGASGSAGPGASAGPTVPPTPKPGAKPTAAKPTSSPALPANLKPTTWWWSASGVSWIESGLQTSGGNWAIVGDELVAFDAAKVGANWVVWSSVDGRTWKKPDSAPVSFAGSKTCVVASREGRIVIVGWHADGSLQGYYGLAGSGG